LKVFQRVTAVRISARQAHVKHPQSAEHGLTRHFDRSVIVSLMVSAVLMISGMVSPGSQMLITIWSPSSVMRTVRLVTSNSRRSSALDVSACGVPKVGHLR
jgi:hypothetical protein